MISQRNPRKEAVTVLKFVEGRAIDAGVLGTALNRERSEALLSFCAAVSSRIDPLIRECIARPAIVGKVSVEIPSDNLGVVFLDRTEFVLETSNREMISQPGRNAPGIATHRKQE